MMAEWRVVHVKEAEALATSPKARQVVLNAAKNPPPGLVLILQGTVPARSRAKFYKDLGRAANAVEFKPIPADGIPAWLVSWARESLDGVIEVEAAQMLAGAVGTDLGVLTQEVRKLAEMAGKGAPIDVDTVRKGGLRLPRQDRWAWFDLVGSRRIPEALKGLPVLLAHGESAVGLVIGLSVHLLRLGVAVEGGRGALEGVLPPYQRFSGSPTPGAGASLEPRRPGGRGEGTPSTGPAAQGQCDRRRGACGGMAPDPGRRAAGIGEARPRPWTESPFKAPCQRGTSPQDGSDGQDRAGGAAWHSRDALCLLRHDRGAGPGRGGGRRRGQRQPRGGDREGPFVVWRGKTRRRWNARSRMRATGGEYWTAPPPC